LPRAPQDKLIDRYYKRNPNARFVPIKCVRRALCDLESRERRLTRGVLRGSLRGGGPHFVQRYAWRQLELMESGLSEEEARKQMDRDVSDAQRRLEKSGAGRRKGGSRDEDEALASMAPPPRTRQFIPIVQADEDEVLQRSAAAKAGYDDDDEEYEEDDDEEEEEAPPAADRQA
jgi:hypothetical protein